MEFLNIFTDPGFWFSLIRSSTPLIFAGMSALIAARAGIANLSIEGTMLMSAFVAAVFSWLFQNAWMGLLAAVITGTAMGLFLAYFTLKLEANNILVAIAVNLFVTGFSVFALYLITGDKNNTSSLNSLALPTINFPFLERFSFLDKAINGQNILVYAAFISVFILNFFLFKTALGLRIRSVGGNKDAAESVGVNVHKTQYIGLAISGFFGGLGGAFMTLGYLTLFVKGMTAGRGFIAVAAANVGLMSPIPTMFASILFGFFNNLGNSLQQFNIVNEFIVMIPYIATIIMFSYSSYRRLTEKKRLNQKLAKAEAKSVSV